MPKIAIVVGTRPEIIKMSPIIKYCKDKKLDYFIVHTGQHYSYNMSRLFFEELNLPSPKYELDICSIGPLEQGEQTGQIMIRLEKVLLKERPDIVLVEGDTNSVLAAALVACKLGIKIGHVEAGLRCNERIVEEINRILTDHISDYLFVPTEEEKKALLHEGISPDKIYVTGNTIVDAVFQNLELAKKKEILEKLNLEKGGYFVVTVHRQENVDVKERLSNILEGLNLVYQEYRIPIIYPMHPRTRKRVEEFGIAMPSPIKVIDPLGYLEFLQLEAGAKLAITDSGGVEEETCVLKVPCVTLRDSTERWLTVKEGANILANNDPAMILDCVKTMLKRERNWKNPYGDGNSAKRIMEIVLNLYGNKE